MVFKNTTRWKHLGHQQQQKRAPSLRAAGTESKPPNTPKYNNKTTKFSWIKLQYQNYNKGATDDDDLCCSHHEFFLPLRKNWLQVVEKNMKRPCKRTTRGKNKFCDKQWFCFFPGELSPFFDKEIGKKIGFCFF